MNFEYFDELNVLDDTDESFESFELIDFDLLRCRLFVIILTIVGDSFRDSFRGS